MGFLKDDDPPNDGLHYEDVLSLTAATAAALIVISVILDFAAESVSERLEKAADTHNPHQKRRVKAHQRLWSHFQEEVTTLGFLAFVMWIFGQAGFFTWSAATWNEHWQPETSDGDDDGDDAASDAPASPHPHDDRCTSYLPRSGEWLEEHTEVVSVWDAVDAVGGSGAA